MIAGGAESPQDSDTVDDGDGLGEGGGFGSLGSIIALLLVVWAAVIATFPLNDNSFFTHLATGRLILDTGSVPTSDPYTFTALGADWTVQSWLASVAYAGAEQVAGDVGLRVVMLVAYVAAVLLVWRLTRPAKSLVVRLLVATAALFVGTDLWGERPYMIGIIGLALVWLALDGAVRPWLLVPLLWVWANAHGSFPLAGLLVLTVMAGEALDRGARVDDVRPPLREHLATELRVLVAVVVGTLAAVIGPLGIDVLLFPLKAVTRSDVLANIVEWQPPGYRILSERVFLVLLLAAIASVVRQGKWRLAVPLLVFGGSAVLAQRNVVMATIVFVPILASGLPVVGTLTSRSKPALGPVLATVCAALACLAGALAAATPAVGELTLGGYPVRPLTWLDDNGVQASEVHIATQDFTGNLIEVLDGPTGSAFIDDRADMFPSEVFDDNVSLVHGEPDWGPILDTWDVGLVIWERSRPLASLLAADADWQVVFSDGEWMVSCRRNVACDLIGA